MTGNNMQNQDPNQMFQNYGQNPEQTQGNFDPSNLNLNNNMYPTQNQGQPQNQTNTTK